MRRLAIPLILGLVVTATAAVGIAWSLPSQLAQSAPSEKRYEVHRVAFSKEAAWASCGGQSCVNGGLQHYLRLPGSGPYQVTIEVSFQYHTRGSGQFVTGFVTDGGATAPTSRRLAHADGPTSTTVSYEAHLTGGSTYNYYPSVGELHPADHKWSIRMTRTLITIDALPTP
jgi:hypothetical protein